MAKDVVKRVAKDGTQRGLFPKVHKRRLLMSRIKDAVERDTGIKNWDPVIMLSIIAARSFTGYPEVDHEGHPVLDEKGHQVIVPPDYAMAAAAAAKVTPYLHSQLRPKDPESEDDKSDIHAERRERILASFERMGLEVRREPIECEDAEVIEDDLGS